MQRYRRGLGPIRHLAIRGNGDVYISTPTKQQGNGKGAGIIALHLNAAHAVDQVQHFGSVDGGTGIRFFNGALYASSPSGIYRCNESSSRRVNSLTTKASVPENGHILPYTLWKYSKENASLTAQSSQHLAKCQDCVAVLILCRSCESLRHLQTKFRELAVIIKRTG